MARTQERGDREPAASRSSGQSDVVGAYLLFEQATIGGSGVVDWRGMHVLGRPSIVQDQGAAADRLGEMAINLPMREHGAGDVAAAMRAEQHSVLATCLGDRPERRDTARIDFE